MQDTVSLILQNRLLMDEVKQRIDQLGAINTVAAAVGQSLDLDQTLETALGAVLDVVDADAAGISLIEEQTGDVVLRAQRGWVHDFVNDPMRIPAGKGMSGDVIRTNNLIVDNDLDGTEEFAIPSFKEEHFRAILMAPMRARGKIIGILSTMSYKPNQFPVEVYDMLRAIADTVGVAIDNARLYENTVEQENHLSAILQSTGDGIIATDQRGCIQMTNHTAHEMLNFDGDAVIGMPLREAPILPRVRDALLHALSSRMEGHNKSFQVTLEDERVISAMVSPVNVESQVARHSETDGWVIVLQDVTHLREAEIARAQFIQAAAHDMRNPLSVTQSSLVMLQDMIEGQQGDVDEIIRIALTSVDRLQALIDDLLHLEQIESGYGFNRSEVNLKDMIYETGLEIKPLMENKALHFSMEIADNLPTIPVDRHWLSRALQNYLSNAAKYTQEGGKVLLRAAVDNRNVFIEVVDNGPGIAAQDQVHLFERFYRVKGVEGIRGTGLGLAIVKSVAEAHGGTVYVRSKEGHGSIFGMTLPVG